jgi:hypothetical protein
MSYKIFKSMASHVFIFCSAGKDVNGSSKALITTKGTVCYSCLSKAEIAFVMMEMAVA